MNKSYNNHINMNKLKTIENQVLNVIQYRILIKFQNI